MIIPDVNLLLYAEIDAFEQHRAARGWWERTLGGDRQVGLTTVSVFGFLRIATNRRVFALPLSINEAVARVREWLAQDNVVLVTPGSRHLDIALPLLERLGTGASLTTDVQLAAIAIENNADLCSNDADFRRFEGLRWIDPLAATDA